MTTVSPALTSLPVQPASAGSAAGPKPDSPDTFSSTLDREMTNREMTNREMANRSPRRAPDATTRTAHRADPHAAHRPAALRGRAAATATGDVPAGKAADGTAAAGTAAAGTAPAGTADTTAQAGVPAAGTDTTTVPGADAMLAAAVALAQQQVKAQPADPRVTLAVPGSKPDAGGDASVTTADGAAPKPPAAAAPGAGLPMPPGVDAAGLGTTPATPTPDAGVSAVPTGGSPGAPTTGLPTDTPPAVSVPPATPPSGSDSPATATSIADALAADAAATSAGTTTAPATPGGAGAGLGPGTGSGSGSGSGSGGSASSTGQQPGSDAAALPSTVAGATSPDPTRSEPASTPAAVTPATITAAVASKVAETADIAATEALLNAAGAGAPLTIPDVNRTSTDGVSARTAAALPSHVAELARLAHISSDGTARLTVRLDPPELGAVTLHMTSRGSDVELSLRAETPAGAAALAGQQARVRDLLASHGFDLSHFTIAGVTSGDDAGFADPRQRDQSGTSAGDPGSAESRFSTDPDRDGRGSTRSGFAGSDGFGSDGRPGSRTDDGWSENVSPTRRSTAASTATEGTWL